MQLIRTDKTSLKIDRMPQGDATALINRFAQLHSIPVADVERMLESGERIENRFYVYRKDNRQC